MQVEVSMELGLQKQFRETKCIWSTKEMSTCYARSFMAFLGNAVRLALFICNNRYIHYLRKITLRVHRPNYSYKGYWNIRLLEAALRAVRSPRSPRTRPIFLGGPYAEATGATSLRGFASRPRASSCARWARPGQFVSVLHPMSRCFAP